MTHHHRRRLHELGLLPTALTRRKLYAARNPAKVLARSKLYVARRDGRVVVPVTCEGCGGSSAPLEGHHHDYEKPLDVQWLCRACHRALHRVLTSKQA